MNYSEYEIVDEMDFALENGKDHFSENNLKQRLASVKIHSKMMERMRRGINEEGVKYLISIKI